LASESLNQPAELPREFDRWNWGAFLLNWIWGIGNSTFIALLALIPGVNFIMMIVLGLRGSRWAWRNRTWRDIEEFRRSQRRWAITGVIVWIVVIGGAVGLVGGMTFLLRSTEPYRTTMNIVRADEAVKQAIGDDVHVSFWFGGSSVSVENDGSGQAAFNVPIYGSKGSGTAVSRAIRTDGNWSMRLVYVLVDGSDTPIVIVNEDKLQVPNAPIDL
jgi:hypothetical protein